MCGINSRVNSGISGYAKEKIAFDSEIFKKASVGLLDFMQFNRHYARAIGVGMQPIFWIANKFEFAPVPDSLETPNSMLLFEICMERYNNSVSGGDMNGGVGIVGQKDFVCFDGLNKPYVLNSQVMEWSVYSDPRLKTWYFNYLP